MIDVEFKENCRVLFKVILIWNILLTILLACVTISHVNFQKRFYIPPIQQYTDVIDIDSIELEPMELYDE